MIDKHHYPIVATGTLNTTEEHFVLKHRHWQVHLFLDSKTTYHIQPFHAPQVQFSSGVCGIIHYDGLGIWEYAYAHEGPPFISKYNWLYRMEFKEGKLSVDWGEGFDVDLRQLKLLNSDITVGDIMSNRPKHRSIDTEWSMQ